MDICVIIVNWNTRDMLADCLRTLPAAGEGVDMEVVVVDNASEDGSADMVEREFPWVRLVRNQDNVGFARANNQVLRGIKARYALLLNSDTLVRQRGLFARWTAWMDAHPRTAMSGPRLVFPDGSHQVGDAGSCPCPRTAFNFAFFLSRIAPRACPGLYWTSDRVREPVELGWICGAALMARTRALEDIGLMDEGTFMYGEDVEWGCRARTRGHAVHYLPELEVVHLQGGSGRRETISLRWLRNLRALYGQLHPGRSVFLFDLFMACGYAMRAGIYLAAWMAGRGAWHRRQARGTAAYSLFCLRAMIGLEPGEEE